MFQFIIIKLCFIYANNAKAKIKYLTSIIVISFLKAPTNRTMKMFTSARKFFFTQLKEPNKNYKMTKRARKSFFYVKLAFQLFDKQFISNLFNKALSFQAYLKLALLAKCECATQVVILDVVVITCFLSIHYQKQH